MLLVIRVIIISILSILICLIGSVYSLFKPKNPDNVYVFGRMFGRLSRFIGVKIEVREQPNVHQFGSCIYIANHQSNYDMLIASKIVQKRTVTVGKKSLFWVPFFGVLYWLTGNILIDRQKKNKAYDYINQIVEFIKKNNASVWIFPEGSRSKGKGLIPFKKGAFLAAITAGIPIVPICVSDIELNLNRWRNRDVIIEMLPPIDSKNYNKNNVKEFVDYCYDLIQKKLTELNTEIEQKESLSKLK